MLLSLILGGASLALKLAGAARAAKGEKKQAEALKEAEGARHIQMLNDWQRRSLELIRQNIQAQSLAVSNMVNQGAGAKGSSARSGGYGATSETNRQQLALDQNLLTGERIFQSNLKYYEAGGQVSQGQALQSLGGTIMQNLGPLSRLGNFVAGKVGS